jgi:hypothetical protein
MDKLMTEKRHKDRSKGASWHLVQADLDKTNKRQARKMGEHHVRCHMRQHTDTKKGLVQNCRFWPLMRALKPDGSFGETVVIEPNKVDETLGKQARTQG